jgi:hypothetical protein
VNEESQVGRVRRHLLGELRTGTLRPGSPISVKETATTLRTSHTPVREALERLAGEGVVRANEGRQGFSTTRYGNRDLADLHNLLETLMLVALGTNPPPMDDLVALTASAIAQPAIAVEDTIGMVISSTDNRVVSAAIVRTSMLLAPYRRAEPTIIPDWLENLNKLRDSLMTGHGRAKALHAFTKLRTSHATRLIDESERPADMPSIRQV